MQTKSVIQDVYKNKLQSAAYSLDRGLDLMANSLPNLQEVLLAVYDAVAEVLLIRLHGELVVRDSVAKVEARRYSKIGLHQKIDWSNFITFAGQARRVQ